MPIVKECETHVELGNFTEITYCVECKDERSGEVGTFAYDELLWNKGLGHFAISPVFDSVDSFYNWGKSQGFHYHKCGHMLTMSRDFV